jgi:hypothetical protein
MAQKNFLSYFSLKSGSDNNSDYETFQFKTKDASPAPAPSSSSKMNNNNNNMANQSLKIAPKNLTTRYVNFHESDMEDPHKIKAIIPPSQPKIPINDAYQSAYYHQPPHQNSFCPI